MPYKVTAPVARSTAYDFNAHLARSHTGGRGRNNNDVAVPGTLQSQVLDVMPHEILFHPSWKVGNAQQRMMCSSSINGVELTSELVQEVAKAMRNENVLNFDKFCIPPCEEKHRTALIKELDELTENQLNNINDTFTHFFRYCGVAVTGCAGGAAGAHQRQGFSASRGGLMTVINTGHKAILAGQRVRMQFDLRDILRQKRKETNLVEGIPRHKIIPRLVAVNPSPNSIENVVKNLEYTEVTDFHHERWVLIPKIDYLGRLRFPFTKMTFKNDSGNKSSNPPTDIQKTLERYQNIKRSFPRTEKEKEDEEKRGDPLLRAGNASSNSAARGRALLGGNSPSISRDRVLSGSWQGVGPRPSVGGGQGASKRSSADALSGNA